MRTDPIAEFLTRIRNASSARKRELTISYSGIRKSLAQAMVDRKFLESFEEIKDESGKVKSLTLVLKTGGDPLSLKRISKPGQRIYIGYKDIKRVRNGLGIGLISTSTGIMTDAQAREKKVGGEYLCEIF